jgi:anthranilate synthase component 2
MVQTILDTKVDVLRNDQIELDQVQKYDKILISPGPGIPDEAGQLKDVIKNFGKTKSILGVCLGLQAIAEVYGGKLENVREVYHGLATDIHVKTEDLLFQNQKAVFKGGRYHSWIVSKEVLPDCFNITAEDASGYIMALAHKSDDVKGVQFHPESVLTPTGEQIIRNWLFSKHRNPIELPSEGSDAFDIKSFSSKSLFL